MKKTIKGLLLCFAAMLCVISAHAQVTTSSLNGRVADKEGVAVPGATVVAVHTPSGTQYYAVTNANGQYAINGMRVGGPYTVEVSCLGYATVNYTDVTLKLGEPYALNAALPDDTQLLSEAIVISTASSKFATERTGAVTNISNSEIVAVPTVNRSISDVTRLSPYGGNGMSFAGTDGRLGNFTVDGANFNNNFGLSKDLPGGGNPISLDAIEEMQVVISPFDVRQTNFIGGGVNAITKSGTNTFKGSAYIYHKNQDMQGDTIEGEQIAGARAKSQTTTYGMTLGGPIIKNKLFFFVNTEYVPNPTEVVRWRGSENGVADPDNYVSRTKLEDLATVSQILKEKYGYDTGAWDNFSKNNSLTKILARVDWNINDNHHLAVRYNYTMNSKWKAPNETSMDGGSRLSSSRTSKNSMSFYNSMYNQGNLSETISVDLNSRLGDNLSNQFLVTYSKLDDARSTDSEKFPFIDICKDGDNYIAAGYELFTLNNGVHNTVVNAKDELIWYAGDHKVTGGVSFEYQMADNIYMRNGIGYYRYKSLDDFKNGKTPEVVSLTYGYGGELNPAARVRFYRPGVYAQDDWSVNEKLKVSYGLRIDGLMFNNNDLATNGAIKEINYYDDNGNVRNIDTGLWPSTKLTVSPRIGFTYDIFGNKSLIVRGGTGLFSGRLPLVFFTNMPTNAGTVQYAWNSADKDLSAFAGDIITDAAALRDKIIKTFGTPRDYDTTKGSVPSKIAAVDPKFKMPQVWKTSIAFDYAVPVSFPFTITAEGIFNKTVNDVMIKDWAMYAPEGFAKFNGADNRPIFPKTFRSSKSGAFVLENTNKGYGWTANITAKMSPVEGLNLMAAYTHTVNKEITGMPGSDPESAFYYVPTVAGPNRIALHNSQYVTPDRIIASATYNDKSNNHFSLIYEAWRGDSKETYMLSNDMNGDSYQYDLIYVPTDAEVANNEFRFATPEDATRFMDYVHNSEYLSSRQGKYVEPYSLYSPWVNKVDFSYKHDFRVKVGQSTNTLQLSFDMKNVLNFFNSSWGVSKVLNPSVFSEDARVLKYEGLDAQGYATFSTAKGIDGNTQTFTPSHTTGQCWYASIGIKYMFN